MKTILSAAWGFAGGEVPASIVVAELQPFAQHAPSRLRFPMSERTDCHATTATQIVTSAITRRCWNAIDIVLELLSLPGLPLQ
jgi:hypothetical protein